MSSNTNAISESSYPTPHNVGKSEFPSALEAAEKGMNPNPTPENSHLSKMPSLPEMTHHDTVHSTSSTSTTTTPTQQELLGQRAQQAGEQIRGAALSAASTAQQALGGAYTAVANSIANVTHSVTGPTVSTTTTARDSSATGAAPPSPMEKVRSSLETGYHAGEAMLGTALNTAVEVGSKAVESVKHAVEGVAETVGLVPPHEQQSSATKRPDEEQLH
ncbi:hypothetical protein DFS34DRAFT_593052 [Phlyctochytrium arcticum]|nr:hypothetical protein DFS34DRAFT_593052 [Phlyctochytrium arcticum]